MAVSALELRPRGAIALLDAAIRLCARTSGVWALSLPAGAVVVASVLHLFDALDHGRDPFWPAALVTLAWLMRGIFMGASCHLLEQQVLGQTEPTPFGSLKAALRRLPSLTIAVGYLAVLNVVGTAITLGLAVFFMGAHVVGYAVTMHGKGHPLELYGTCAKALGHSRTSAVWVRMCFWVQLLAVLNLHIAANVLIYVGRKLLALDLTYAERFCSLDNRAWVAAVIALSFTLFEPLRAAASTLLLIDGRVRQEGLDLLAAIEQLPKRRQKKPAAPVAAALLLVLVPTARAQEGETGTELQKRLVDVAHHCRYEGRTLDKQIEAAGELAQKERIALSRFVAEVEGYAYDEDDCEYAVVRLERGLPLLVQARDALKARSGESAQKLAQAILGRPEFRPDPVEPRKQEDEPEQKPPEPLGWWEKLEKWWDGLWKKIGDWLKELFRPKRKPEFDVPAGGIGLGGLGNVVFIALIAAVLVLLVYLLVKARAGRSSATDDGGAGASPGSPLEENPMSALARPPEGWASSADELAAKGEYREAVRHLYLALLSKLHRVGAIDYDPAKSNWDYFRGFKGRREWVPPFRELTSRFDFTWYGKLGATADGYRSFRELARPLLAPDETGELANA